MIFQFQSNIYCISFSNFPNCNNYSLTPFYTDKIFKSQYKKCKMYLIRVSIKDCTFHANNFFLSHLKKLNETVEVKYFM